MSKTKKPNNKFQFGTDFQEAILHFIISDKNGYKAIDLVDDSYFVLIPHAIICKAIKQFWKVKHRIPSKQILNEKLRLLYDTREFSKLITDDEKVDVSKVVDTIYQKNVKDADEILTSIIAFARYVNVKAQIENNDVEDFDNYPAFLAKIQSSINIGSNITEDLGTFLVEGVRERINLRTLGYEVSPTPFRQLNKTLNAGGIEKHSLIMVMAEEKRFKTGLAINWGRLELRRRKRGFYVDYENGEIAIATRGDQGVIQVSKLDILQGKMDEKLAKTWRKYKRLGSELAIKRFSAYRAGILEIQAWMDRVQLEKGIRFDFGIIDHGDLGKCTTGRVEDDKRISDFYIDLKNLAKDNDLDYILTLSHVKRDKDTLKRRATTFISADVAKCQDKVRHCDMVLGLQENEEEQEAGVMRLEVIVQRDGTPQGKVLLWVDIAKQYLKEFSVKECQEYYEQLGMDKEGKKKEVEKDI